MAFDDRAALDAGLASDAMRAAGRNLREIAPGPRDVPRARGRAGIQCRALPRRWILSRTTAEGLVTMAAPPRDRTDRQPSPARRVRPGRLPGAGARLGRRRRRPWPASRWSRSTGPRRSTRSASTCSTSSPTPLEALDADAGLPGDRDHRCRRPRLRRRRRHPRAGVQTYRVAARRPAVRGLGPARGDRPAADRRRPRLRARRRLRAGDDLRPDRGRRGRDLRPAGDPARGDARRRRARSG